MDTYEEKYNEALERAKTLYENANGMILKKWVEQVFPELAESEDERIRKSLIDMLKNDEKCYLKEIAWLEKQGEHANFRNKIQIGDKVTRNEGGVLVNISQLNRVAKERKKQGETKPFDYENTNIQQNDFAPKSAMEAINEEKVDNANKVEPKDYNDIDPHFGKPIDKVVPKFKVGDWVVWDNKISCHIDNIYQGKESLMYTITDTNNMTRSYSVKGFDNNAHLWDITKDAKDGDVLKEGSCIFILRKMKSKNTAITHCCLFDDGDFNLSPTLSLDVDSTFPATKEQRDILFAKMKEEGYVWLSCKKRLVKLLFKEGDTVRKKLDGSIWHINYINEHGYWGNHKPLFPIENQNEFELVEKKHWSEDDEERIKNILSVLDVQVCWDGATGEKKNPYQKEIDWLKSLKSRVQPEQEWSEENDDEAWLNDIICKVEFDCTLNKDEKNWLKSLKPQTTWKPSDKQMIALRRMKAAIAGEGEIYKPLNSLYEDLKKLREE